MIGSSAVAAGFLRSLGVRRVKLTSRFTHVKLYVVDDYVIVGSHNLSASGFHRYELSVMMHSPPLAEKLSAVFKELILTE